MDFLITASSDVGIKKDTNQDSVLLQVAQSSLGKIAFGVICDGMGGLAKGELASATLIKVFASWFLEDLKYLLEEGFTEEKLYKQWGRLIEQTNKKIARYGQINHLQLGTTLTAVLILSGKYYCVNVGDSRAYLIRDTLTQISRDHSYIQREMDLGHITEEEAKKHPHRNVLLQCIGASEVVVPEYFSGTIQMNDVILLCSDGFRHVITPEEIFEGLNSKVLQTEQEMKEHCNALIELNKSRREQDNISVAVIKAI